MTHNLHEFYSSDLPPDAPALPWVADFTDWVHDKIEAGATDDLVNYRTLAPHAADNHPTDEHLMPLFIAIGAGGKTEQRPPHPFEHAQRRDLDGHLRVRLMISLVPSVRRSAKRASRRMRDALVVRDAPATRPAIAARPCRLSACCAAPRAPVFTLREGKRFACSAAINSTNASLTRSLQL